MNSRIKDLAEQAGYEIAYYPPGSYYSDGVHRGEGFELEQLLDFASLIVTECAAMTRNLCPHGELAEQSIKEHFGVE